VSKIDLSTIRKILVIRPDAIGDLVTSTPAIAALRKKFPQAHIAVLARKYNQLVIKNNPDIDEIILDELYDKIQKKQKIRFSEYKIAADQLCAQDFVLAINFCGEFAYALVMFLAGIRYRIGDRGRVMYSWLYNHPVLQHFNSWAIHEVEHHFELLQPLGIEMDPNAKLKVIPTREAVDEGKKIIAANELIGKPLIAFNIGTSGSNKPWAVDKFIELIRLVSDKYQTKIVLLGGPKEEALVREAAPKLKDKAVNLVGLSLENFIGLLSQMQLYVANDTGPTHIAAALQIPSVILYTSKYQKPGRWAPWANRHKIIKVISDCPYPCNPPICQRAICTTEIGTEEVAKAIDQLMSGEGILSPEEERLDREKLTFNLLIVGKGEKKEQALGILKTNGWRVWTIALEDLKKLSLRELQGFYHRYDINIVHAFPQTPFKLRISTLLTSLTMPFPVFYLRDEGKDFKNITALADYYTDKFNKRVI